MLAIENYGRFWRRDKVYWGRGKNKGHLKGELKRNKSIEVDFRDQIGIYVLFDANRRPLYVGQAGIGNARLFQRLKKHRSDHLSDRWQYFSWFGLRRHNENNKRLSKHQKPTSAIRMRNRRDALHETEAVLISVVEPILNKRGPNWTGSKEFMQHLDERVPLDDSEMLGNIVKTIEGIDAIVRKSVSAVR
ncbi:MAG: GIY-YIG nuclease family protein [Alphaproteobacteria bacterium]|nr:GIY-YIG nuclease family protein [Alphaproteobacteria bacterium]